MNCLIEAVLTCTCNLCFEQRQETNQYISTENYHFLQLIKISSILHWTRCVIGIIFTLYSNNCLIDFAYPHDFAEYQEHLSKLPGERHNLDAQCKLIQGKDSKLCEVRSLGLLNTS